MTTTLDQQITLAQFLKLPETKPASEFINGRIYQKPMPQGGSTGLDMQNQQLKCQHSKVLR